MIQSTYERIDRLETGLHGLVDGLSGDNAWGLEFDSLAHVALDGTVTVNGVSEGVNDSAEHALTNGHVDDGAGSLDNITFLDLSIEQVRNGAAVLTYRYRGRQYQHYQFPS